jgi:hypothetical protein
VPTWNAGPIAPNGDLHSGSGGHPFQIEDYDEFYRTTGTSIDRVAAPLQASWKRSIVWLQTARTRCFGSLLLLLSFIPLAAAADCANYSTPCRSMSGTSPRVATNGAANRTNSRSARRPAACSTLRLLRVRGGRRGIAGIKSALAYGPLITLVFVSVLLLLGLSFGRIYIWPAGLCARACRRNANHKYCNGELKVEPHK